MTTNQPPEDKSAHLIVEVTAPWRPSPGLRMQALEQAWEEDPSEFLQRVDELAHDIEQAWEEDPSEFLQRVDELAHDIEQALARTGGPPAAMVSADPAHHGGFNRAQADRFHDADR